jgi:hypothetical protein
LMSKMLKACWNKKVSVMNAKIEVKCGKERRMTLKTNISTHRFFQFLIFTRSSVTTNFSSCWFFNSICFYIRASIMRIFPSSPFQSSPFLLFSAQNVSNTSKLISLSAYFFELF